MENQYYSGNVLYSDASSSPLPGFESRNGTNNYSQDRVHPTIHNQIPQRNATIIDPTSNPLYIHNSDQPGISLVSEKLIGLGNFNGWCRLMLVALGARTKIVLVNGEYKELEESHHDYNSWFRCNNVLCTWIVNAVSPMIAKSNTASDMWSDLHKQFQQSDDLHEVTCCLYICGDDCYAFLKLELLIYEFYVKMLMDSGGLRVMAPHGDSSLTEFQMSVIVVMVQPLNLFVKQEACYLEVLISFVESFIPILFSGSDFLQPAISSFLSLVYCEFDSTYSTVKIVIKLKNGEFDVISSYDESSSIVTNRFHMSVSFVGFICDRLLHQRSMMILFVVHHFVSYLIQPDRSDFLGCSAEYANGSIFHFVSYLIQPDRSDYLRFILMDKYPSVSGFVEFKTPPDLPADSPAVSSPADAPAVSNSPADSHSSAVSAILNAGFKKSSADHFLFTRKTSHHFTVVLVYVDDLLVMGDDDVSIQQFKDMLQSVFKLRDMGAVKYFLGFEVAKNSSGISINQRKYTLELLEDAGFLGCKPVTVPMDSTNKLSSESGDCSFVIQEHVDTSSLLSTFIFGSLTRPPELHCASVSSLSDSQGCLLASWNFTVCSFQLEGRVLEFIYPTG